MRVGLINRLRSQRGASLSMSLMLLLACITITSIVLTASSAATGRLAQLRKTDKSYYNVTSAANLFWDIMSQESGGVAVEVDRSYDGTNSKWTCTIDGKDVMDAAAQLYNGNATLFEIATCDLLLGTSGALNQQRAVNDAAIAASVLKDPDNDDPVTVDVPRDVSFPDAQDDPLYTLTVEPSDEADKKLFDEVKVEVTSLGNGDYQLAFSEDPSSCLCVIEMVASVSNRPVEVAGDVYTWKTTVRWQPQYLTMGGAA